MNSKEIYRKFLPYISKKNITDNFKIRTASSFIENQKEESIVFLNITKNYPVTFFRSKGIENVLYVTTENIGFENEITVDRKFWNEAKKIICDLLYPINKNAKLIGITGTNGKTSTAFYLSQMFDMAKQKVLYTGTIGTYEGQKKIEESKQTSPDYIDIRKLISLKYDYFIFEVSSHALEQDRFYQLSFDAAAWTSFSQDHLDYHKTLGNYFDSKKKILNKLKDGCYCYVYNKQEDLLKKLKNEKKVKAVAGDLNQTNFFTENNMNLAIAILHRFLADENINLDQIASAPGRFELFEVGDNKIIVDFAHTPEALEILLKEVKNSYPGDLVLIFGCGGDRDKTKRAIMGRIANNYADHIVITEDNNRSENFEDIAKSIARDITKDHKKIADRKQAIEETCGQYHKSVIVIAGKGHENYIERNNQRYDYSDLVVVRSLIK